MRKALPVALVLVLAAAALGLLSPGMSPPKPSDGASGGIRVLVQGEPGAPLEDLLTSLGGTVTHRLPIIDAIGALVDQQQLGQLESSSAVSRLITDLSLTEPEQPGEDADNQECAVGGALELALWENRLSWDLHNKTGEATSITHISLKWPENLGRITHAQLGTRALALPDSATTPGAMELSPHPEWSIPGNGVTTFSANFENDTSAFRQHQFTIRVQMPGECETKLIPGYPLNRQERDDSYFPTVAGVDVLHQQGVTGEGVTAAIIDSGLWHHPAVTQNSRGEPRVVALYDAIADKEGEAFDESGHGTHITSVLASSQSVEANGNATGSFKGIAPDARIVAVKAFNVEGQADYLDLVRAVQYVVDNRERYDIRVLNLSFASRPRWHYWLDPVNQALMKAWAAGITIVAAAGNEGPEPMSVGSPGNLPYLITVGAVTDSWTLDTRDDDYIPDFSSRGPTPEGHIKPDIVAPGGHISGITRPGSTLLKDNPEYQVSSGEYVLTGTSQASAVVAGISALLLQLEPGLTPDQVKCMFTSSAEPAINRDGTLAYSPFQQGAGVVTASRAITLGERECGNQGLDLARDISGEEHFTGPAIFDDQEQPSLPGLELVLSPEESTKGLSTTRKWGVKEHIERPDYQAPARYSPADSAFNWEAIYLREKQQIEQLSRE